LKKVLLILMAALALGVPVRAADAPPATSAEGMILVHPASGRVLAEKNAHSPMLIASTTKLMTALVAAGEADLDAETEIRPEWTRVEGSSMYLRSGERYTVRELLQGLLLASGNDAALALAAATAGDTQAFVDKMNRTGDALGLEDTHFDNPHGLDSPTHRSSAADLARIMAEVLKNDALREILAMPSCTIHGLTYENHNRLLRSCPGVCAGKTGYTMAAGRCLVTACVRDGLELICVTLSDPSDWADHAALYDWACGAYCCLRISTDRPLCELPLIAGRAPSAEVSAAEPLCLCVEKTEEPVIVCSLPPFAFAPVREGERAGELTVALNGETAARTALVFTRTVTRNDSPASILRESVDRLMGIYAV